jgi:polysaccharide chain length determinant protein (PEP-CTERM system associated)
MPLRPDMEPAEFLDILRRRKWMILFTVLLVLFGATLYCVLASDLYQSTVKIRIIPPAVPEGMVRSTVSIGVKDRLELIQQEILSSGRLNAVIDEMGLFKQHRKEASGNGRVDLMRKRITMDMDRTNTLTLSVDHENPQVAKEVASRLGSFFIEQNTKSREAATQGTTQFLESQLEGTRKQLEAQEDKLKQYKIQYGGELPEQMQANLGRLARLQDQIKSNTEAITRMEDRKVFIESQIHSMGGQNLPSRVYGDTTSPGRKATAAPRDPAEPLLGELATRRKNLEDLQSKYTPLYPAVVSARTQVEQLEARIALLRQSGSSAMPSGSEQLDPGGESNEVRRLRGEVVAINFEIAAKKKEIAATNRTIDMIQSKVERLPQREQEMISLTRDYSNIKNSYDDLLKKKLQANISENLEEKQQGEQFIVLEPAALPAKPIKPDRLKILALALMASLVIGAGGAVGLEVLDPKLRGAKDFKGFFDLPILTCLPVIENAEYRRRIAVRRAAVIGGLVSITGAWLVLLVIHGAKVKSILLSIGQGIGGGN